jgi:hypothetical protein
MDSRVGIIESKKRRVNSFFVFGIIVEQDCKEKKYE